MQKQVKIIGAGLAGCEAALKLASLGFSVTLVEMRPARQTEVHHSGLPAELVCSNSFKSMCEPSAAAALKYELQELRSPLLACAYKTQVPAGKALAVNREEFSQAVKECLVGYENISYEVREACDVKSEAQGQDALILATGPLTSSALADSLCKLTGKTQLAFYDAAAPIVSAESLDRSVIFAQSRYDAEGSPGAWQEGNPAVQQNASQEANQEVSQETSRTEADYLNAPFTKEEYDAFIEALLSAEKVIAKDFEQKDLFQACQPVEEIARAGRDALRFGACKPVGIVDPRTGKRPWAVLQLRKEDAYGQSYNLVGFQTNLRFGEQERVFRMIPGLKNAEFLRFGVMHRNTFIDAPRLLDAHLRLINENLQNVSTASTNAASLEACPIYIAGQLSGTEGYVEAIRSGHHAAVSVAAHLQNIDAPIPPKETLFGALLAYATNPETKNYQPMHVNMGLLPPFEKRIRGKQARYAAYTKRAKEAFQVYCAQLQELNLL